MAVSLRVGELAKDLNYLRSKTIIMTKTLKSTEGVSANPNTSATIGPNEINPAGPNIEGQTEAVSNAVASLADLTWDERKYFMRRYSEVFSQENDLRSQGKDFDAEAYRR